MAFNSMAPEYGSMTEELGAITIYIPNNDQWLVSCTLVLGASDRKWREALGPLVPVRGAHISNNR